MVLLAELAVLVLLKRWMRARSARRELERVLAERREKYLVHGEDRGEGED